MNPSADDRRGNEHPSTVLEINVRKKTIKRAQRKGWSGTGKGPGGGEGTQKEIGGGLNRSQFGGLWWSYGIEGGKENDRHA